MQAFTVRLKWGQAVKLVVGGVGLRRGRRHRERLQAGDTVDFWRVESIEENRRLRLLAEMKLPGRAWLEFEVEARRSGSLIRQTAIFDPIGLGGLVYWYILYPLHQLIFAKMLERIAAASQGTRGSTRAIPDIRLSQNCVLPSK